ncbi:MAG TPA: sodium transporter, partial [Candidatus Hydrogenedentes bacterium]|nr:sodium transporter [Candidatus Hydrogenedentota bacterium]
METGASTVGLSWLDWLMVGGYFLIMAAIGVFFYGKMRQMKDYFSGGNAIPWWLSGVSFYMSSFSVAAFVFYPSLCYRFGFVGVTLLWVAIPATLFSALLFATRWRRARINSPVEYLESRYSPLLRQIFAWQGIPVRIIDDGMKLLATATFISLCAGIPPAQSVLWTGGIILLTTFLGGLWAVAVTDFIQFVVLTAAVLLLLPLSIAKAGGIGTLVSALPEGFFQLTTPEYGWGYVLSLVLMYALAWSSINWSLIQRYYCVPRERDALKVGGLVVLLYVIGPPLMFFPAMAARQFLPNLDDAGHVYPLLCTVLLPPGIMGLAVAAMFAATMSTLSSDYNVCASVLTNDVYRRLFRPRASERELVVVGRALTILVGLSALGVGWALSSGKAENLFRVMVSLF